MQVQYGSYTLTGIVPFEVPDDFRIVPNFEVQVVKALGAAGITQFDRGNDSHVLGWGIWRLHLDNNGNPDRDAAYAFLVQHEIQLRAVGVATLTYVTNAGTFYFLNAIFKITEARTLGCSSYHKYSVTAGAVTTTAPPGVGGAGS